MVTSETNAPINAVLGVWRHLMFEIARHSSGAVAGTYYLASNVSTAIATASGNNYRLIRILSAQYPTINGKAPKFRVNFKVMANDVAATGDYTLGLYPITRPATSGGAGVFFYSFGTVVAGSTALVSAPAADSMNQIYSSEFALPADGYYGFAMVTTATVAASATLMVHADLEWRNA